MKCITEGVTLGLIQVHRYRPQSENESFSDNVTKIKEIVIFPGRRCQCSLTMKQLNVTLS